MQNWLPAPAGRFYLILRSYAPKPAMVEELTDPKAYRLPDIEVVGVAGAVRHGHSR
jgi:hypothetical protein